MLAIGADRIDLVGYRIGFCCGNAYGNFLDAIMLRNFTGSLTASNVCGGFGAGLKTSRFLMLPQTFI